MNRRLAMGLLAAAWLSAPDDRIEGASGTVAAPAAAQAQEYRPSNLADLVKATGTSRDGLEEIDVTRQVADHVVYIGESVGVAGRFADDPGGAVFVGWRAPDDLWRFRMLDEAAIHRALPDAAGAVRLGRVSGLTPRGAHIGLETRLSATTLSSVVLRVDLTPIAHVPGAVSAILPSGAIVFRRPADPDAAAVRMDAIAIQDVSPPRVTVLYPTDALGPAAAAFSSRLEPASAAWRAREPGRAPQGRPGFHVSIWSVEIDEAADALTFNVTFSSAHPADAGPPERADAAVVCRPMSQPAARTCTETPRRP